MEYQSHFRLVSGYKKKKFIIHRFSSIRLISSKFKVQLYRRKENVSGTFKLNQYS